MLSLANAFNDDEVKAWETRITKLDPDVAAAMHRVFLRNRAAWEARIRDAIVAARVPSEDTFAFAAEGFNPTIST